MPRLLLTVFTFLTFQPGAWPPEFLVGYRLRGQELPVDHDALEEIGEKASGRSGLTNLFSLYQLYEAVRDGDSDGLSVDFSHVKQLLDGTELNSKKLYGSIFAGPYPFESQETRFSYKRFRLESRLTGGTGSIGVGQLLGSRLNSEGWEDRGQVAVRFILSLENESRDRNLGTYDTLVVFEKSGGRFVKKPSLIEGPFVNLVRSDRPSEVVISFLTPDDIKAEVVVEGDDGAVSSFWDRQATKRHEILLENLKPQKNYRYYVNAGSISSKKFELRTAPKQGDKFTVRFAYFGDSRSGRGGGLNTYMGVNYQTLTSLSQISYSQDARFLIVGGDLVNGYTTVPEDFEAQLHAWKQAVTGFWNERPVYTAMGNHEALLRDFNNDVRIDRWPYDTQSAEAVFAQHFVHPRNGPRVADPRRPSYEENVYAFDYGPVRVIAFNNNYWVSYDSAAYGGAPEGYILADQLDWLVRELDGAESDPTIRYVVLFAQEPVFPNGGHVGDAMWHSGDNRVRAHVYTEKKVLPEEDGMLVVRNKFVRALASHRKVAAVLSGDEHAYHRILIGKDVPIGDIDRDDRNKNGKIDLDVGEPCSTLDDLKFNTWYLVCGGGGAPYYAEEETPWNQYWKERKTPRSGVAGYYYSSQENVFIFEATESGISVRIYNPFGEIIDQVENLMADK